MHKFTIYFVLLIANLIWSQNGFIEVEVTDTVHLKPKSFEYMITINPLIFTEKYGFHSAKDIQPALDQKEKELEKLLKEQHFEFRIKYDPSNTVSGFPEFYATKFYIKINSPNHFKTIIRPLNRLNYIEGKIENISYSDKEQSEILLTEKLIQKAHRKAEFLAKQANLTLGQLTGVRKKYPETGWDFNVYDTYFVMDEVTTTSISEDDDESTLTQTLIVKYVTK